MILALINLVQDYQRKKHKEHKQEYCRLDTFNLEKAMKVSNRL